MRPLTIFSINALSGILVSTVAGALPLLPGDIIVSNFNVDGVVKVDRIDGSQELISQDALLSDPADVAVGANGDIYVVNNNQDGVVRIDPITGDHTLVSSGGWFHNPTGIEIEADGNLLVLSGPNAIDRIVRVDPTTGDQFLLATDGILNDPSGIAIVPIPEPSTALLLAFGLAGLAARRRGMAARHSRMLGRD